MAVASEGNRESAPAGLAVHVVAYGDIFAANPKAVEAIRPLLDKYLNHPATQEKCRIVLKLEDLFSADGDVYVGQYIIARGIMSNEEPIADYVFDVEVRGPIEEWPQKLRSVTTPRQRTVFPLTMYSWNPPLSDEERQIASFKMYDLSCSTNVTYNYTDKNGAVHSHKLIPTSRHTPENNPGGFPPHIWAAIDYPLTIDGLWREVPVYVPQG